MVAEERDGETGEPDASGALPEDDEDVDEDDAADEDLSDEDLDALVKAEQARVARLLTDEE